MLIEIKKTEMREIILTAPKYVCFGERIYYRFTPIENTIEVVTFQERDECFELSTRMGLYETHIPILELTHEYAKEITECEFNIELSIQLLKHI